MSENDSFRIWLWVQERRDMAVFWGSIVAAVVAYAITGGAAP